MSVFLRNWSQLASADIITQIVNFFVAIQLARVLNPDGYGSYVYIMAVASIFVIIANLGMNNVIIRQIARQPERTKEIFNTALVIRVAAFIICCALLLGYLLWFRSNVELSILMPVMLIILGLTSWDLAESIAFGHKITNISSLINISSAIIWAAIIIFCPRSFLSHPLNVVVVYGILLSLKAILYFGVLFWRSTIAIKLKAPLLSDIRGQLNQSLYFLWVVGIGTLSNQVPILLLEHFSGKKEEVAYFSVGSQLIIPITLSVGTALRALYPIFSELSVNNKEKFRQIITLIIMLVLTFGSIFALVASFVSPYIIPLLFGNSFAPAVPIFNNLIWFGIIFSLDLLIATTLGASDMQKLLALLTTVDTLIAFPIMYWGSLHGALGMSYTKLGFGIILVIYHWLIFTHVLKVNIRLKTILPYYLFFFILLLTSCMPPLGEITRLIIATVAITIFVIYEKQFFRSILHLLQQVIRREKLNLDTIKIIK